MPRKTTVTQINTRYNQGMQKSMPQHIKPWSRCATAAEDYNWCHSCLDNKSLKNKTMTRILLQHLENKARIWYKQHESMIPSCLVSIIQADAGGVMLWVIFLAPFSPLSTSWALLKFHILPEYCCWSCPFFREDSVSSRIIHHFTNFSSSQTGFLNKIISSLHSNDQHSHQISIL